MTFVPIYTYYCWNKKAGKNFILPIPTYQLIIGFIFFMLILLIQFFNYALGTEFLLNIGMSFVFVILISMCVLSVNALIDKAIKKSTVIKLDAKKYVFYWLLLICLLETFVLIVYSGQEIFLDIDWVKNYLSCT